MGLDLRYIPATYFQLNFIDKTTALPLAGGKVYFYKDQARTILKDIFQISGSPPNYTYTALPNPCTLNANGTFQDGSGNDIVPYFYPLDANGNSELYFVEVYDALGVFQFSREGIPNTGGTAETESADINNYIPNGQFLAHNKITTIGVGELIAPGGWAYERSTAISTDQITFPRFATPITNPTASPRYSCRIQCLTPHPGDTYKVLAIDFLDVNKFSSSTQQYTFSFVAQSNSGSNVDVPIYVLKFYGTGGDPNTQVQIGKATIGTTYQIFNTFFTFGTNAGKNIGPYDDDFVQIILYFPATTTFDISLTDFILTDGAVNITNFPVTTNADFMARGVSGWLPKPRENNLDLYLPIRMGLWGLEYDDTQIGKVLYTVHSTPGIGELLCNGLAYDADAYSSNGIPYSRLAAKLYNYTLNLPSFGTKGDYVIANVTSGSSSNITISQNTSGNPTDLALGGISPGFTLNNIASGDNTFDFISGYAPNHLMIFCQTSGATLNLPDAGTSGFTVTQVQPGLTDIGEVTDIIISSIAAISGTYFLISNTTTDYYVWFKVDGIGVDPAVVGRTGIEIDILSTHDVADVCRIISQVISGYYVLDLQTISGATLTAGSYFTFYTPAGTIYYIWYIVDGVGTDPLVPGALKGKSVSILSTDTADDVAFATVYAINTSYFRVPYLNGQFIRVWSDALGFDPDRASRISNPAIGGPSGDNIGSFQWWQNLIHTHPATSVTTLTYNNIDGLYGVGSHFYTSGGQDHITMNLSASTTTTIANVGGNQSNPVNTYLQAIIKY